MCILSILTLTASNEGKRIHINRLKKLLGLVYGNIHGYISLVYVLNAPNLTSNYANLVINDLSNNKHCQLAALKIKTQWLAGSISLDRFPSSAVPLQRPGSISAYGETSLFTFCFTVDLFFVWFWYCVDTKLEIEVSCNRSSRSYSSWWSYLRATDTL